MNSPSEPRIEIHSELWLNKISAKMITSGLRKRSRLLPTAISRQQIGWFLLSGVALLVVTNSIQAQDVFRKPQFPNSGVSAGATPTTTRPTDPMLLPLAPHLASAKFNRTRQDQEPDSIEKWLPDTDNPAKEAMPIPTNQGTVDQGTEEIVPIESTEPRAIDSPNSDSDPSGSKSNREVIVQRYPDGKPQTERQVIQDENGNYVNDGFWRVLSQANERNIIAQGQYKLGKMEGVWMRKHAKESGGLLSTKPFNMYQGPFTSIALFENNQLTGIWSINDGNDQKVFEIPYKSGKRHGTASWWYPSQNKMREVTFRDGVIHGRLREWDEQKKLTRDDEFIDGQRVVRNTTYYRPKQKQSENYFLEAKMELEGDDDWWKASPAQLVSKGSRVQHGPVTSWYDNGLPKIRGTYEQGERVGRFTWWHSNGNKQLEGSFKAGKKEGRWTWWHSNGMKASSGVYENDAAVDEWTWWNNKGAVEDKKQFGKASNDLPENTSDEPEQLPPMGSEENQSVMEKENEEKSKKGGTSGSNPSERNSDRDSIIELEGLDEMMEQRSPKPTLVPAESKPEISPPTTPGLIDSSQPTISDPPKTESYPLNSDGETSGGQQYIESLFG